MAKTVNQKLMDRYIRHAVYVERFTTGEAKRISQHLGKEVFPELIDKLMDKLKSIDPTKLRKTWAMKRLRRLTTSVDKIIIAGMGKAEEAMVGNLMNLSDMEVNWNKLVIEKTVPLDIDMSMPSTETLRQAVLSTKIEDHKLSTWLRSYKKSVRMGMMRSVSKGISAGESIPEIGRRLRKMAGRGRKQAEAIARTAVSGVVNNAREAVYKQNTDLIKAVMLVATLDTRTTLICINLDGKTFPVGEGPRPPMHFACRTSTVPVTASWKEFGIKAPPPATRASMNGAVPVKTTYKQWLKKQSKATQIKVLGKKRAELYRSGKVTIDKFVGKDYKPLTLKQLAKKEGLLAPPAPLIVKAVPVKGIGIKLTSVDKRALGEWTMSSADYANITRVQRGLKPEDVAKSLVLKAEKKVTNALKKLNEFDGTTYRGMLFDTAVKRATFLKQFKPGSVWKSKTFLATSKSEKMMKELVTLKAKKAQRSGLSMVIKGKSGRDISKFAALPGEKEVLFMKGVPLRVDKVVGNKVYLSEITKQVQLKVPSVLPIERVYHGTSISAAKSIRETGFKAGKSKGMASTPVKEFTFVTPHKAGAKWYGEQNIRFEGKYDIVEADLVGKLYEVKGTVNEYQAMGKFAQDTGLMRADEHLLNLPAIAEELRKRGYSGIKFKDSVSNRAAYAVLSDKLKPIF